MDPKLREQLFIHKHKNGIITIIVLLLILPLLTFFPQSTTQYQQKAATLPVISQSTINTQEDYAMFIKCFDKPSQAPIISGQTNPCSPAQRKAADLNNDGIVNGIDYNLFIRQKTGQ